MGDTTSPSRSSYFFFDVDESRYRNEVVPYYEISTTEEFGDGERAGSRSNCEIPLVLTDEEAGESSEPTETIICLVDLLEGDIQVKDMHFTFNFPGGMCTYIHTGLPWHLNRRIYPGPRIRERDDCPENNDDCGFINTNCQANGVGALCPTNMVREAGEEEALCPGRNIKCCVGGLQADGETEWEPDLECFGGPALIATGDIVLPSEDFYKYLITELPEEGLVRDFTLPNVLSINSGYHSSVTHINYHKDLDKSLENLKNLNRSTLPDFLKSPVDAPQFQLNYPAPRLFFEFDCLDSGSESLHKIVVMLREWNTLEEFLDFFDDGGNDRADPDVTGVEGDNCAYEDRTLLINEGGNLCNDYLDMDDYDDAEDARVKLINRVDPVNRGYPVVPYSATEE